MQSQTDAAQTCKGSDLWFGQQIKYLEEIQLFEGHSADSSQGECTQNLVNPPNEVAAERVHENEPAAHRRLHHQTEEVARVRHLSG